MIIKLDWYKDRCAAAVFKADTYRRTGRGPTGFSMHYKRCQCERKPVIEGLCTQHAKMAGITSAKNEHQNEMASVTG